MSEKLRSPWDVIASLEQDNSRLAKEKILEQEVTANNQELVDGLTYALDKLITFGVKQVPEKTVNEGQGLPWTAFLELIEHLRFRRMTGNEARDAIKLSMEVATQAQWNNWYRRILIKDLKCGVSEKTVNKVLKNSSFSKIPVFECQLAHDGANYENKISGKKILQPKLDGVRILTVIDVESNTVTQYSRNGKELVNFTHLTDNILKSIDQFGRSYVLDGEVVSNSFQDLMTQVNRKSDVQANDARLVVFDIMPLTEFKQGKSVMGQRRRHALLETFSHVFEQISTVTNLAGAGGIEIISQIECDLDSDEGKYALNKYNSHILENGFEGIMVKDPDAKYECKRSTSWLKIKPFIEVSLEVKDVEEGTGRNEGRLGALVCSGFDDDKLITVNVGSGFSDSQRDEFWADRENVVGTIVEIRADAITQNQDGTYSLRFPRFLRFRGFANGEKI